MLLDSISVKEKKDATDEEMLYEFYSLDSRIRFFKIFELYFLKSISEEGTKKAISVT